MNTQLQIALLIMIAMTIEPNIYYKRREQSNP
jgi:hypothetical protein